MKITKDKTPLSCIWQLRLLGIDYMFGYIKVREAAEMGEDNANVILKRKDPSEYELKIKKEIV